MLHFSTNLMPFMENFALNTEKWLFDGDTELEEMRPMKRNEMALLGLDGIWLVTRGRALMLNNPQTIGANGAGLGGQK